MYCFINSTILNSINHRIPIEICLQMVYWTKRNRLPSKVWLVIPSFLQVLFKINFISLHNLSKILLSFNLIFIMYSIIECEIPFFTLGASYFSRNLISGVRNNLSIAYWRSYFLMIVNANICSSVVLSNHHIIKLLLCL